MLLLYLNFNSIYLIPKQDSDTQIFLNNFTNVKKALFFEEIKTRWSIKMYVGIIQKRLLFILKF